MTALCIAICQVISVFRVCLVLTSYGLLISVVLQVLIVVSISWNSLIYDLHLVSFLIILDIYRICISISVPSFISKREVILILALQFCCILWWLASFVIGHFEYSNCVRCVVYPVTWVVVDGILVGQIRSPACLIELLCFQSVA